MRERGELIRGEKSEAYMCWYELALKSYSFTEKLINGTEKE